MRLPLLALPLPVPRPVPPAGAVWWVCGGRSFQGAAALAAALGSLPRPSLVLHGGAGGADRLAAAWAAAAGVPCRVVPAEWSALGRAAGPARNRQLAALAVSLAGTAGAALVVAFPGGRGTASAVRAAKAAGLQVWHPLSF